MTCCGRCKRELKNPIYVALGYGPVCWAKIQAEREREENEMNDKHLDIPRDEWIVAERHEDGIATNVPHLITDHSPSGFEFGYGGSGPADFALNILETVLRDMGYDGETTNKTWKGDKCFKLAYALHQPFKAEFIAGMPREGGRISTNHIIAWIDSHKPMFTEVY